MLSSLAAPPPRNISGGEALQNRFVAALEAPLINPPLVGLLSAGKHSLENRGGSSIYGQEWSTEHFVAPILEAKSALKMASSSSFANGSLTKP